MKNLIFVLLAVALVSCEKEPKNNGDVPEVPIAEGVRIWGSDYELEKGSYYSGYYEMLKQSCLVFHIELTNPAGITVEISKDLIGKSVSFEQSNKFWFFAVGNGDGNFITLSHDRSNFVGYSGWFVVKADETSNKCELKFELLQNGQKISDGNIAGVFQKISSL